MMTFIIDIYPQRRIIVITHSFVRIHRSIIPEEDHIFTHSQRLILDAGLFQTEVICCIWAFRFQYVEYISKRDC